MRIALIALPAEGAREALRRGVSELRGAGHDVHPHFTFEQGDAAGFAQEAAAWGAELVIAAGGDGTVNEVVNGLVAGGQLPRLGIIPLGTANDFAKGLGIPLDPARAFDVAVGGRARTVDVARVNDRCFVNVSTGGFGAEATEEATEESKKLLGPFAYLVTGMRKFAELRPAVAHIGIGDDTVHHGDVMLFAVGNARQTGGGCLLTPRADFGDGLLDLLVVPGMTRMEFIKLMPELRAGTHLEDPRVIYTQAPEVTVESEEPLAVNADGEPTRGSHFDYRLLDRTIDVSVPPPA